VPVADSGDALMEVLRLVHGAKVTTRASIWFHDSDERPQIPRGTVARDFADTHGQEAGVENAALLVGSCVAP